MKPSDSAVFNEHEVLHELKHYLPAQSPLKDFIHHNTLHSFQDKSFHVAIRSASEMFGYRGSLRLDEFRANYNSGKIREDVLDAVIIERQGAENAAVWKKRALETNYDRPSPRIGALRSYWKKEYRIDLDSLVHPILFRMCCSFFDQGIAIWKFPITDKTFLSAIRELERGTIASIFRRTRARTLLLTSTCEIADLLKILVGDDETFYKQYLFDQQFAHQGWSGIVSAVENEPQTLLEPKKLSTHDLIVFDLLLEIDALDSVFGEGKWQPLITRIKNRPVDLFAPVDPSELTQVIAIWQEAMEWSYYGDVIAGLEKSDKTKKEIEGRSFQAMFCIDDRECSIRRYLEHFDPQCETFGTPGFFNVEFFFQPDQGKFYTKLCPWPVTPKYLIKEIGNKTKREQDVHFSKHSHSFYSGWLISQTLGFWSALKLFINIFRPSMSPATASSFKHMDKLASLTIENKDVNDRENNLQIGFTIEEMATRVEFVLKSIGLVKDFAPLVYIVGHGSSSVNNPHFAAYDCGACSGRAGSVNARVISHAANHPKVREILRTRGLNIPDQTQFVGGLHDTTRDEVVFFDENSLSPTNREQHTKNEVIFQTALDNNAKERSRRFLSINTHHSPEAVHREVTKRSVSLFEPRPEYNHATNTLCIIGRRTLTKHVFLDRRAFLNSYDHHIDKEGELLFSIMKPIGPVCGGINLEYFFSRTDNMKLGAGTKLPHNVMGLFGVANGIDGDLRPGLPSQMIEIHDPLRLLVIVEVPPDVLLKVIQRAPEVYQWYINEWVNIVAIHPDTYEVFRFKAGSFIPYKLPSKDVTQVENLVPLFEEHHESLPVYLIP